jgi:hypothetical protein
MNDTPPVPGTESPKILLKDILKDLVEDSVDLEKQKKRKHAEYCIYLAVKEYINALIFRANLARIMANQESFTVSGLE